MSSTLFKWQQRYKLMGISGKMISNPMNQSCLSSYQPVNIPDFASVSDWRQWQLVGLDKAF